MGIHMGESVWRVAGLKLELGKGTGVTPKDISASVAAAFSPGENLQPLGPNAGLLLFFTDNMFLRSTCIKAGEDT